MPLLSIPAIYDGNEVKLLEGVPVQGRYRVLVTFLEPDTGPESGSFARLWASFTPERPKQPNEESSDS